LGEEAGVKEYRRRGHAVIRRGRPGDREEPVCVDRGLAMLGGDDDGGRVKKSLIFKSRRAVDEFDLI
jgi:hypothetical protein